MRNTLLLFLMFSSFVASAQISNNLSLLVLKPTQSSISDKYKYAKEYRNEIEFVLSKSFVFYKKYISSQDISSCNFTPSCSEYAFKAIKTQGIIIGSINFFDRFARCNGINAENYQFTFDKRLLYDPVRNFKGKIVNHEQ